MTETEKQLETEIAQEQADLKALEKQESSMQKRINAAKLAIAQNTARLKKIENNPVAKPKPNSQKGKLFIDVSSYQGVVNWEEVSKAGLGLIGVAKATEGLSYRDGQFANNWQGMKNARYTSRGAYLFWRASDSPSEQVNDFLEFVHENGGFGDYDFALIDLEVTDGQSGATVVSSFEEGVKLMRSQIKNKIGLYGGAPFFESVGLTKNPCSFWHQAAYVTTPSDYWSGVFKNPFFWQYSDGSLGNQPHSTPGVGSCDHNVFLGHNVNQLKV